MISSTDAGDKDKKEEKEKVITTKSGLKYVDQKVGTGKEAKKGDIVAVHYTGTLKSGKKFDSSLDRDEPIVFPLGIGKVIPGWDEGIAGMKEGGKRKLIVPPDLGYGPSGQGPIPPNSELHFDVELVGVK
jgi:peptidylprolyl isomerase